MSTVVLAFGRLNPITVGHEKLADKIKSVAKKEKATPRLYLSHSHDKLKNPLPYNVKLRYAKKAFGPMVTSSKARTIIEVLKELSGKFDDVIVVAGGDRIQEFLTLLLKYNHKDYTFNSIRVVNAGDRDPDADDVSGMSASKMRAAASTGDLKSFKSGLPKKIQNDAEDIYNSVRMNMGITESFDEQDMLLEVLNMQQRRARKMMMRRIKSKIARGRRIARKRMAKPEKIKARASKKARELIRKRVAGKRAEKYKDLPISARIQIDKQVEKRKGMISKLAKRMIPKVRKAEQERLKKARSVKKESIEYNDIENVVNRVYTEQLAERVEKNLRKKADKYDVPFEDIREAYFRFRAHYNEQETFQTINSALANEELR